MVQKLLRKARKGTRVIYVPGNHDEPLRDYVGMQFGGIDVLTEAVHETADGRRFLVIHGDAFDGVVRYARWLALLGDRAYATMHAPSITGTTSCAVACGYPYWSLSAYLKHKVKNAVKFISDFEQPWPRKRKRRGVDGVICGHIHKAEITRDRRHPLLQRRRLGGELHRAGRASRRPAGDHRLGGGAQDLVLPCWRHDSASPLRADAHSSSSPTPGRRR